MMVFLLATFFAAAQSIAADAPLSFSILRYNTPGTAFVKAGLGAWPMVMDYDGDGDLDIVIRSHGVPARHHGTWLFENTGKPGDLHPLFRPARRLGDEGWSYGGANAQTLTDGRLAVMGPGNVAFDFRENGMRNARTFAGLPRNVHENNVRGNIWRFADLDGDGREDLTVGVGDWKEYGWDNAWDSAGVWTNGPLHGYVYFIRNESGPDGKEKWGRPEKICMANGAPIDVYGSAAPLFADWDGDGDLDLLTCDFVDSYTYFENLGTKTVPKFACGRPILDNSLRPIKADLCMVTATVADWDGDGSPDVIACEEDARVCLIRNTGRVAMGVPVFEAPYWFRQTERDHVHFGILVTPSVIDWDGDGDEDIITGNSAGYVAFIENLSGHGVAEPKWAEPVLLESDGAPIRIIAGPNGSIQGPCEAKWGYTCLSTGDWDGDGLPDIMINSIRGEVVWCRNIGTRTAPRLAPPAPVAAEWEGAQPELAWGWMKPNGSKNILTQWRTTPLMYDMNGDGLMDLVMVDTEGFLAFWERARAADGRLILKHPRRAFIDDATGAPMGVSGWKGDGKGRAGSSGRRKLCLADWDGDGKPDLIMNSENVILWRQVQAKDGCWRFARQGNLADEKLAGHTTSPCACDFDGDGVADLLVGAEDGFFYHLANKGGKMEMFDVSPRKVVNIVNFVRALDPRRPKSEYLRALREEVALNLKYGFENTILLQYDALVDAEMMSEARKSDPAKTEFGLWFEMSRPHNEAAGLAWRPSEKHKGWEWDWFINPGFLMAYDHEGRKKLIDAAFARFKAEFGAWPKSVGSWLLDAWSMDYMVKTYGVDGFCICREQDSTDAYGLRGGYSNGAYYPSRKSMLSAAVDMKNAVRAPVFKMLTPDPIYNYGLPHKLYPSYPHSGGCPTMEPVWYGGHTPAIVDWYFRVYTEPKGLLNLSYMQTGQENAFGWPMISKGLPMQYAKIAAEAAAGRVVVEKMGNTARTFKAAHSANCPQTQIALEDWTGAGRKSVWYNSRYYRANLVMDGSQLFFRDIHKMSDDFEEPFLNKVCTGWQALYYTPPVIDQWLFHSEEASGTMALSGDFKSIDTAAEGDRVLTVTATRADGMSATVRFEEGRIVVVGCGLSGEYAANFRKTLSVEADGVCFAFVGYSYRVPVRGKVRTTAKGFRIDGDRIELDLSSDGL